jgi:hypothetical protein
LLSSTAAVATTVITGISAKRQRTAPTMAGLLRMLSGTAGHPGKVIWHAVVP